MGEVIQAPVVSDATVASIPTVQPLTNAKVIQVTHQIMRHETLGDILVLCTLDGQEMALASDKYNLVHLAIANNELHQRNHKLQQEIEALKTMPSPAEGGPVMD